MIVFIWATLLLSVRSSKADTGASVGRQYCDENFCIRLTEGLSQKPTVTVPPLTEGHQTTLTCTAPGLCSGSVPEITWTWRGAGVQDSHITGNITDFKTETLTAVTQRHASTLTFDPSAEHHGTEVTCKVKFTGNIITEETVTLNVTYVKKVKITGDKSVKEGQTLNLTCSVESFPPSFVIWTKLSDQTIQNVTEINLQDDTEPQEQTGMSTLLIPNVTADHSGQYMCTVKHLNSTLKEAAHVTVTFVPKIFNDSSCVNQSDVLTCVCVSEGVPLPTIRWPLLETHTEYSVTNTVSNHTVTSRIRLSLSAHSTTTFECVSSNDNGQTKLNVSVKNDLYRTGYSDLGPSAVLPWTIAAVSLCLNIICLVIYILYLCRLLFSTFSPRSYTPAEICSCPGSCTVSPSLDNNEQVQSGFKGRVSLLEPELSLKNCSIIINDLNVSDSGSYQLRAGGLIDEKKDGWTFIPTTTVKVSGLSQKPTVTVPPLTEGHQTTLTCTAPGLCSGSVPEITWTWRGAGVQDSHITGNITDFKTETLTAVTQRHSSTLTFDPSAEHHGLKKQSSVNLTENVEMATIQTIPLVDADQAITDEITRHPKEVEYTDIDVSKLKRKSPTEDKETRRIPDTEYAEVKKEKRMKRQDNDREEGDTMGVYEEAAVMIVDDKESEKCVQTEEEGGLSQKPTVTVPPLTEGHQTTLTCTAPGLCSGSVPEITWTWRGAGVQDSHITGNITDFKTETLTAVKQRHRSTLTFNLSAEHHGTEVTCKVKFTGNKITEETVTLNVFYLQKPVITGLTTVKEGDDLNLSCTVESFPPSVLTWTKHGSNKTIENRTATLFITNVTPEDSGRYICSAEHQIKALTAQTDVTVTVTFGPKIFNDSICVNQSDVLTCVCVSEGVPLPTIRWPLLETHTEYSVTNTVSNHTVTSRIRLSLSAHSTTTFECVSSNDNGQTKHNVSVKNDSQPDFFSDFFSGLLTNINWLHVILAFFIGILLSMIVTCLARKCNRKIHKSSINLTEKVEMVTTQKNPGADADQAITDDITHDQDAAEGAEAAWPSATGEDNVNPKEVEYTDIDVSKLKRNSPTKDKETRRIPDTEYAEVKKEKRMESQDNEREEGDTMGVYEEAAVMIVDDKESEKCVQTEEEGGEDVALYSNVNEIMTQI
ncbi:hypothetical protein Q5P01_011593 [Channa striata]|uniref:Ig-like domain-containing protein n=1 Tax=Channa striata TaxID=64152 RepID=A0AA88SVV0_CHASR|nr:hypothetical protein Q5P01_011593 [Channa striata]